MVTIIAGSRSCIDYRELLWAVDAIDWRISRVVSGCAKGADSLGERWASENRIPIERFPADWYKYGKSAGYRRNVDMVDRAEALLALWDRKSRGTKHVIDIARKHKLVVHVWEIIKQGTKG